MTSFECLIQLFGERHRLGFPVTKGNHFSKVRTLGHDRMVRLGPTGYRRILGFGVALYLGVTGYSHSGTFAHVGNLQAYGETGREEALSHELCSTKIVLREPNGEAAAYGLIRITRNKEGASPLIFDDLIARASGWYSIRGGETLLLPRTQLCIEITRGMAASVTRLELDLTAQATSIVEVPLRYFYDPQAAGIVGGNTHLHLIANAKRQIGTVLKDLGDTDRYLRHVGGSDDLDLLYVSHLTRPERTYISNDYTIEALRELSNGRTIFGNGIEHRHGKSLSPSLNGKKIDGETVVMAYGHVLLLDMLELNIPESIGPGLTAEVDATDNTPMRKGMAEARRQGGGVVWCHGTQGLEDIPDWLDGLLDAQNIYDGGSEGSFEAVFYRYLNAGIKVPFSTGTDWGVWDFSRVYVPLTGKVTSRGFLQALREGRSYITNGPFLEFSVNAAEIGDTVKLANKGVVQLKGKALARTDFLGMQIVQNGEVIHEVASKQVGTHFEAVVDLSVTVQRSGWLALRILPAKPYSLYDPVAPGPGINIFNRALFAHTSPIYISVANQPIYNRDAVESLLRETRIARKTVDQLGVFETEEQRAEIVHIYRTAEATLESLIENEGAR